MAKSHSVDSTVTLSKGRTPMISLIYCVYIYCIIYIYIYLSNVHSLVYSKFLVEIEICGFWTNPHWFENSVARFSATCHVSPWAEHAPRGGAARVTAASRCARPKGIFIFSFLGCFLFRSHKMSTKNIGQILLENPGIFLSSTVAIRFCCFFWGPLRMRATAFGVAWQLVEGFWGFISERCSRYNLLNCM